MSSYQYRKSHCGDKTVVRSSYLHSGTSYTGKMTSLYWFDPLILVIALSTNVSSPYITRPSWARLLKHNFNFQSCLTTDSLNLFLLITRLSKRQTSKWSMRICDITTHHRSMEKALLQKQNQHLLVVYFIANMLHSISSLERVETMSVEIFNLPYLV